MLESISFWLVQNQIHSSCRSCKKSRSIWNDPQMHEMLEIGRACYQKLMLPLLMGQILLLW